MAMASAALATNSPLPPAREIPSSFFSSVKSWWAAGEKDSAASEERLLRHLPFFQSKTWQRTDASLPVVATSSMVKLSAPKQQINTFSMVPEKPISDTIPAVILHGYGAGLGFFFRNFPVLGRWVARSGTPVHAIDWLGMGRSARVPFVVKAKRTDTEARVKEAEAFFVDSLEDWRQKMGLEKMQLVGHSLGAYLSVAYTLKHPTRVSRLILLSPAGVPADANNTSVPSREVTDQMNTGTADGPSGVNHVDAEMVKEMREEQREDKRRESRTRRLLMYLWEEGWSPFQVLRNMTVFAPLLVGRYASRRFSGLTEEETRNMNDYILNIALAKGSGEYCISHILAPGAQARLPLVDRISAIQVPVTFVYGDHDWMDPEGGVESVKRLRAAGNTRASMEIIRNAGHHVYLDNPPAVNDLLVEKLSERL